MVVNELEVGCLQLVFLTQMGQILQNLLRAIDFGVLEIQLVGGIVMKGPRPHHSTQLSHVSLKRLSRKDVLVVRQRNHNGSIAWLHILRISWNIDRLGVSFVSLNKLFQ